MGLLLSSATSDSFACWVDQKAPSAPPLPPPLEAGGGCGEVLGSPDEGGGGGFLRGIGGDLFEGIDTPAEI